jgi:hypothetical protein
MSLLRRVRRRELVTAGFGLGPNAPSGLTVLHPAFDGSTLPGITGPASKNAFGMYAFTNQANSIELTPAIGEPYGGAQALRLEFPQWNDPRVLNQSTFMAPDWGGAAPSQFMMAEDFDGSGRIPTILYARMSLWLDSGHSQFGVVPPSGPGRAWNVAIKFFFPKLTGRLTGSGNQIGVPWSADFVGSLADNHFVQLWVSGSGFDPEGPRFIAQLQQNRIWNGSTVDGNGYPVWDGNGTFGFFPNPGSVVDNVPLAQYNDFEFEFGMNTPGAANGTYRCWVNGTLLHTAGNVTWAPSWVPYRPPGHATDVALAVAQPRWSYMFCAPTYGGGPNLPFTEFGFNISRMIVGFK